MKPKEYLLTLAGWQPKTVEIPANIELKAPTKDDAAQLAAILHAAYGGLIAGEQDLKKYLASNSNRLRLDLSRACFHEGTPVSVCVMSFMTHRKCPLIDLMATHKDWKHEGMDWKTKGLATACVNASINAVVAAGFPEVRVLIAPGHAVSERMAAFFGFSAVS